MTEILSSNMETEIFESARPKLFEVIVAAYLLGNTQKFDAATNLYERLEPAGYLARLSLDVRLYTVVADRRMYDEISGPHVGAVAKDNPEARAILCDLAAIARE